MQKSKVRPKHFSEQKSSWVWCIGWIATQPKTLFCGHKKLYATMEKVHWKARRLWWQIKPSVIFYICWNKVYSCTAELYLDATSHKTKYWPFGWRTEGKKMQTFLISSCFLSLIHVLSNYQLWVSKFCSQLPVHLMQVHLFATLPQVL